MSVFLAQMVFLINNIAFTLFTIFFLLNKLSAVDYGVLMYVLGLSAWIAAFMDYGFSLSIPKYIQIHEKNNSRIAEITVSVLSARLILSILALGVALILACFVSIPLVCIVMGCTLGVAQGSLPVWYYQGKPDLLRIVLVDTLLVVTGMALVGFLSCSGRLTVSVILVLFLAVRLCSVLITNVILLHQISLRPSISLRKGVSLLRSEYKTFVFYLSGSLYTSFNVVILGFFVNPAMVGIYTSIEKIIRICTSLIAPMTRAIYPSMLSRFARSHTAAIVFWRKILAMYALLGCIVAGVGFYFADIWMGLVFGERAMADHINIFRMLILTVPCIAVSNVLGVLYMLPKNMEKEAGIVMLTAGVTSVAISAVLVKNLGIEGMSISIVLVEFLIVLGFAWCMRSAAGAKKC